MSRFKHKSILAIAAVLLIAASLAIPFRSTFCAPSGSARFSGTDVTLNIGDTVSIGWAISATENVLLEATFEVSSGLTVTGPIQCAQGINGGTSANKVLDYSGNFAAFSGNITVRADRAGQFTVRMSEVTMISAADSSATTITSPIFTVYVRTKEQTDASIAEQERIRREQEERASREQAEAASRAASISASASEEERRRKEKEDAEYREWLSRSEIEASESAKAASISASESEVEASISASESEVAASISASESEVERTRPTEMGNLAYVRYTYGPDEDEDGEDDEVFYLVTPEGDLEWPEGTRSISMRINDVNVLALKVDGMSASTYLVYGMKDESDVPSWFYWHRSSNQFFRYDYLHNGVPGNDDSDESTVSTEESTDEQRPSSTTANVPRTTQSSTGTTIPPENIGRKLSVKDVLTLVLSGAIGGAALTALIFLLVLKGRKKGGEPDGEEANAAAAPVASENAPQGPKEKTGDTDAVDLE